MRRFPFKRDQEIVVIVILVLNFSLLVTRFPNFSVIYTLWWDPRDSKETCALIGYQRAQNVFSFPIKVPDFSLYLEKSIIKSFRVLARIKANTMNTVLKEISEEDIQNCLNLCTPCIFVYRNRQCILQEFYE